MVWHWLTRLDRARCVACLGAPCLGSSDARVARPGAGQRRREGKKMGFHIFLGFQSRIYSVFNFSEKDSSSLVYDGISILKRYVLKKLTSKTNNSLIN